ncbi:hypothetical protein PTE30175_03549 [Pandoraea terrae]|uniref:Uncharacterized protein n=1 Tax=Pandoraea terrae TaxID=1537710 RepID=A0A5E4X3V6_9BURK|nr:hypothetical protein [Pandoraea terrae]VVE30928.1 hypothetical protein PTE30175_03549 [Pandoraea terrae]
MIMKGPVKLIVILLLWFGLQTACHACGGTALTSIGTATAPPIVAQASLGDGGDFLGGMVLGLVGVLTATHASAIAGTVATGLLSLSATPPGLAVVIAAIGLTAAVYGMALAFPSLMHASVVQSIKASIAEKLR